MRYDDGDSYIDEYKTEYTLGGIPGWTNAPVPSIVFKPPHYANKEIETIDYIKDTLTDEEYIGYCIGNVFKYISRHRKKGGKQDLEKAKVYLSWAIDAYEKGANDAKTDEGGTMHRNEP